MKSSILVAVALLSASAATAQNYIDAMRFNRNDIMGSARSQAMGSAFGALGADLTAATINPAGMASYRATELGITMGVNANTTSTSLYGFGRDEDKISVPFNQIGAAFTFGLMRNDAKGIVSSTFSIGYTRLADYNQSAVYTDVLGYNSLLDDFCASPSYIDMARDAGWVYDSFETEDGSVVDMIHNIWEMPLANGDLDMAAREGYHNVSGELVGLVDYSRYVKQRGYKGETTFAYAFNVSNRMYFGASVGIQSLYHHEKLTHHEQYFGNATLPDEMNEFKFRSELKQNGTGVNFKMGAIYRPVDMLRIGFALHSPTFFSISERYSASITDAKDFNITVPSSYGDFEYNYRSPGRMVVSLAGILGRYGILSFDYERSNHGKSKFKENDTYWSGTFDKVNDDMKAIFQKVNTFRIGAESRLMDMYYVRAGYKLTTSPLKGNATFYDYKNTAFSCGLGLRYSNIFVDLGYVHSNVESEYNVFEQKIYEDTLPTSLKQKNSNFVLTLGLRF